MASYTDLSKIGDLTIFKENIDSKVRDWITLLPSDELDLILEGLELRIEGSIFERANRLYKRLQGDYTADDFVCTRNPMDNETIERRNNLCKTFMQSEKLPLDIRNDLILALSADLALDREAALQNDFLLNTNSSSNIHQPEDMSLTTLADTLPVFTRRIPNTTTYHSSTTIATTSITNTLGTQCPFRTNVVTSNTYALRTTNPFLTPTAQTEWQRSSVPSAREHEATIYNTADQKLEWYRMPDGTMQYIPEITAIELRRALIAEDNLNSEIRKLRDHIQTLEIENDRLQNINMY